MYKTFVQFLKFGVVGLSNTAISLCIYYLFVFINSNLYLVGNVIGFIISVLNSFYWNNKYVFNDSKNSRLDILKKIGKTYLAYGGTALLSTLLLYLEVSVLGFSKWIAPLFCMMITIPLNFLINKFWTFRHKKM